MSRHAACTLALLLLSFAPGTQLLAQGDTAAARSTQRGFTMYGTTGFFLARSPVLVEPGNIHAGFSFLRDIESGGRAIPPVAIGYGIARLSETYIAFTSRERDGSDERSELRLGLKTLGLEFGHAQAAISAEYCSTELVRNGTLAGTWSTVSALAVLGVRVGDLQAAFSAGIANTLSRTVFAPRARFLSEFGLSFPVTEWLLLIAEGDVAGQSRARPDIAGRAGMRFFIASHVQLNAGIALRRTDNTWVRGVFFGAGFSTAFLSAREIAHDASQYFPELPELDKVGGSGEKQ